MTSPIDYVVRTYFTNEENLLEKIFPPCCETYKDHQQTICKRFEEIMTFEPGLEIIALKMLGIEQYMVNVPCTGLTFKEGTDGVLNRLVFENAHSPNTVLMSHYWKGATPHIFADFISFAGHNLFPNLDKDNKLQDVDIYCSKVLDFVIDDSPPQIDEVKTIHVSKTKVFVNGSFEIPLDENIPPRIHGYYNDRRLAGFVIDKFIFYFPDVHIKIEERLFGLVSNRGVPERVYKPGKMVMTGVKKVAKKPSGVNSHMPTFKTIKHFDETTWKSFCHDFPEGCFERFRLMTKELERVRKEFNSTRTDKGENDDHLGELVAVLTLLAKGSGDPVTFSKRFHEEVWNKIVPNPGEENKADLETKPVEKEIGTNS